MRNLRKVATAALTGVAFNVLATASALAQTYYTYGTDDAAASGIFGAGLLIYCCVLLVGVIIWIALAVWVYKDAKKNNPEQATLWLIVTLLLGLLGVVVYLVAGRNPKK